MDSQILEQAQEIIGRRFENQALLVEALTHASIAESRVSSNERLEFLGDAVLGMIVCESIFRRYPGLLEGDMTKIKSAVVSRRTCAIIAARLGLGDLLKLGKGMQGREQLPSSLLAAVFESVIGAIFLEAGLDAVKTFVMPHLGPMIESAADSGHQHNFKSVLQQHAQQSWAASPMYVVIDEQGPDHSKTFHVCVEVAGRRFPGCWGQSKKQAEQQAALLALREMGVAATSPEGEVVIIQDQIGVVPAGLDGQRAAG